MQNKSTWRDPTEKAKAKKTENTKCLQECEAAEKSHKLLVERQNNKTI